MPTDTITTEQTITILKHLANGRQPDFVATVTHLPQADVERVAETYDWPDMDHVREAIFQLTRTQLDQPKAQQHHMDRPTHMAPPVGSSAPRPDLTVARRKPAPSPAPEVTHRTAQPSAAELIHAASESKKVRTRNLGTKIAGLLGDLSKALRQEREAEEAAEREAAQKAANAKRIAELEAELARLKGKKTPTATASTAGEPTAAQIRVWAAENNVECPGSGRVPKTVREAYDNAHRAATHVA